MTMVSLTFVGRSVLRTNIIKCFAVFLLFSFVFCYSYAQTDSIVQPSYQIDIVGKSEKVPRIGLLTGHAGVFIPQNNFRRNLDATQFSIGGSFLYQIIGGMASFGGIELNYTRLQSFSAPVTVIFDMGSVMADATTTTSIVGSSLKYRFYPELRVWKIEPFIEGSLGYNWIFTTTSTNSFGGDESSTVFNKNDLALTYGIAGGINFSVSDSGYLMVRVGYHPGFSSHYYTMDEDGKIPIESTIEAFSIKKSTTDAVKIDIGYTFAF